MATKLGAEWLRKLDTHFEDINGFLKLKNIGELESLGSLATQNSDNVSITGGNINISTLSTIGNLNVGGDLNVAGTVNTINSENILVEDKLLTLGNVDGGLWTDLTADGGGISLKGATDKTFLWLNTTDSWKSSENIDLAAGKEFRIGGVSIFDLIEDSDTTYEAGDGLNLTDFVFSLNLSSSHVVAALGFTPAQEVHSHNYDNYDHWKLSANSGAASQISSGELIDIVEGGATSVSLVGGVLTISSTDTNTTYSSGNGISLNGTTFSLNLSSSHVTTALGFTPANSTHNHDDRYYTETETGNLLDTKLNLTGGTLTGPLIVSDTTSGGVLFKIEGANGVLFQIADDLSSSLLAVNDVSGLTVFDVSDDQITLERDTYVNGQFDVSDGTSTIRLTSGSYPQLRTMNANGDKLTQWVNTMSGSSLFDYSGSLGGYFAIRHEVDDGTTEAFKIDSNGKSWFYYDVDIDGNIAATNGYFDKIGIGTITPDVKLSIVGSGPTDGEVKINASGDGSSFGLFRIENDSSVAGKYIIGYGSTHSTQPNEFSIKNTDGDITFYPNGLKKVTFNSNGDVSLETGNFIGNLTGNADTVTNGVYTNISYDNPSWINTLAVSKITGTNNAFNKTFGTTAGTVAQGNDSRINNGQTAFGWGNHADAGYLTSESDSQALTWSNNVLGITGNASTVDLGSEFLSISYNSNEEIQNTTKDANTLKTAFTYLNKNSANEPTGLVNGGFVLSGKLVTGEYYHQQYLGINSDSFFFRSKDTSTEFTSWYQVASREWVNAQSFLTTSGGDILGDLSVSGILEVGDYYNGGGLLEVKGNVIINKADSEMEALSIVSGGAGTTDTGLKIDLTTGSASHKYGLHVKVADGFYTNLAAFFESGDVIISDNLNVTGNITGGNLNITNWNTAYTERGSQIAGGGLSWNGTQLEVTGLAVEGHTHDANTLTGTTLASNVITSSLTTVGALNSGSITSGFGNINIGSSSLVAGNGVFAGNTFAITSQRFTSTALNDTGASSSLAEWRINLPSTDSWARIGKLTSASNQFAFLGNGVSSWSFTGAPVSIAGGLDVTGDGVFGGDVEATNGYFDKIGVGTLSPSYPIHAYKTSGATEIRAQTIDPTSYASVNAMSDGGNVTMISRGTTHAGSSFLGITAADTSQIYSVNQPLLFGTYTAGQDVVIGSGNVERIRILGTGNIGIGTITPEKKLHIAETSNTGDQLLITSGSQQAGGKAGILFRNTYSGVDYEGSIKSTWYGSSMTFTSPRDLADNGFRFNSNDGTNRLLIDTSNGNVSMPTGNLYVGSTTNGLTNTKKITVESNGYAGIELIGDSSNDNTEPGGAYVKLFQDGEAVEGIFSTIQSSNQDGAGGTFTGTSTNSVLLGNKYAGSLHLGTNGIVRATINSSGHTTLGGNLLVNGTLEVEDTTILNKSLTLAGSGANGFIHFSGSNGGNGEGLVYTSTDGVGRFSLFFPGNDIVRLANRASNGVVQIAANNATGGSSGESIVAEFQHDQVTFNEKVSIINTANSGDVLFSIEGSNGVLFQIADDLTQNLLSINNVSGLSVLDVTQDHKVEVSGSIVIKPEIEEPEASSDGVVQFVTTETVTGGIKWSTWHKYPDNSKILVSSCIIA